jgi:hypothetical protein
VPKGLGHIDGNIATRERNEVPNFVLQLVAGLNTGAVYVTR